MSSDSPTFGRDGSFRVHGAVGSASISPSGRDIVLGSPSGLHIIDLDNPWSPPRHVRHQQPWEVADVQWSPFAIRDYWVASTSNRKALVWNLAGNVAVEHILQGHSRAITDINFSAHEPDILATCGVDSFVHCWDLRHPKRPSLSFADWTAGATQVKWNRQDENILASSHDKTLHIWDKRFGSRPTQSRIAHATKIYGIDWNRMSRQKIITCSLDHSIKLWDLREDALATIKTSFPVWRARHTPFGWGILAMPQRGNSSLHLYDARSLNLVHSFPGHENQVKEFLWRSQGSIDDVDRRNFQLVSWGTDKNLLLHQLNDETMGKVGFEHGPVHSRLKITRKGAVYKTFHTISEPEQPKGLSKLLQNGSQKTFIPISRVMDSGRPSSSRDNPIRWMAGVKIGRDDDSLGDEIAQAGNKYKHVTFEEVDVAGRRLKLSLTGPWGADASLCHITTIFELSEEYPDASPSLTIENTPSISDAAMRRLGVEIKTLCDAHSEIGKGSLEAIICYLLGERQLDEALALVNPMMSSIKTESSSDDEHDYTAQLAGSDLRNTNANVPLPKACGALWSADGRLVCFFPNVTEKAIDFQNDVKRHVHGPFDAFGIFTNQDSDSDSDSATALSKAADSIKLGSLKGSLRETRKQTVTIRELDMVPAKISLAERYILFGDGSDVCRHNARIAEEAGLSDLAEIWHLVALIIRDDVPLMFEDDILVLAKRAAVRIRRKDSGVDLGFDEPDSVVNPVRNGRLKWGAHPLGAILVRRILDFFEERSDLQMLAMLVCVLSDHEHLGMAGGTATASFDYFEVPETVKPAMATSSSATSIRKSSTRDFRYWKHITKPTSFRADSPRTVQESNSPNAHSYSSSPEEHIRRSQSMLSARLAASLSKPFSFMTSSSESPPEFSVSAPGSQPGLSWLRRLGLEQETQPEEPDGDTEMVCTMKNTAMFEDHGKVSLLDPTRAWLHRAWREAYADMLYAWRLPMQRAEVLKFQEPIKSNSARILRCTICTEMIRGLFKSCHICGHFAHVGCSDLYASDAELQDLGCSTGCGCPCDVADEAGEEASDANEVDDVDLISHDDVSVAESRASLISG